MGEAKRRRDRRAFVKGVRTVEAEGQGVWQMSIYAPDDVAGLLVDTLAGDERAAKTMAMLHGMMGETISANPPRICLTCDNEFTAEAMPHAWVLVHAIGGAAKKSLGNGICAGCHARYPGEALVPVATEVYRQNMIPDLRILPPMSEAGRA